MFLGGKLQNETEHAATYIHIQGDRAFCNLLPGRRYPWVMTNRTFAIELHSFNELCMPARCHH